MRHLIDTRLSLTLLRTLLSCGAVASPGCGSTAASPDGGGGDVAVDAGATDAAGDVYEDSAGDAAPGADSGGTPDAASDAGSDDASGPDGPPTGEGIFAEGCPAAGQATARVITVDAHLAGPDAVGGQGDLLLMNEHVAAIISAPGSELTY